MITFYKFRNWIGVKIYNSYIFRWLFRVWIEIPACEKCESTLVRSIIINTPKGTYKRYKCYNCERQVYYIEKKIKQKEFQKIMSMERTFKKGGIDK